MPTSGDDHPSVSSSAPCGEPYVLKIEAAGLHVVSEDVPVLQPGPTDKRSPARQYPTVPEDVTPEPAAEIAEELNDDDWDQRDLEPRHEWGTDGVVLPYESSGLHQCLPPARSATKRGWLVLQRDHQSGTNDGEVELTAWICWDLDDASLQELVTWAHPRWTIEQFHRDIKQVLGADEFQGRTWRGFHHHMAVALLTQAFVAEQRLDPETEYGGFDSS